MPESIIATGTTVSFGTSSFSMNIDTVQPYDLQREAVNMSHMGTQDFHVFTPAMLVDAGELTIDGHFDPDIDPPIDAAAEEITVQFPPQGADTTGATAVFNGFMTGYRPSAPMEDKATCTATIKITGGVTITAGS
jgi:hypothetical protein